MLTYRLHSLGCDSFSNSFSLGGDSYSQFLKQKENCGNTLLVDIVMQFVHSKEVCDVDHMSFWKAMIVKSAVLNEEVHQESLIPC